MRLLVLFVSLVIALPAAAQQACSDFELVGFTSTTYLGTAGVLGLTVGCQAEFPDSRMCTSVEVMQTVNVPAGLSGDAWVRPVFVPVGTGSAATATLDASGLRDYTNDGLSCRAWSGFTSTGLVVSSDGAFSQPSGCATTPRSVACCAAPPGSNMAAIVPITSPVGRMMLVIAMLSAVGVYWTRRGAVAG